MAEAADSAPNAHFTIVCTPRAAPWSDALTSASVTRLYLGTLWNGDPGDIPALSPPLPGMLSKDIQ